MEYARIANTKNLSKDEWLGLRQMGIGGSDAGAIAGFNPYASPTSVYYDKIGLTPPKQDSEAMRQGRDFEDHVAKRFAQEKGLRVRRINALLQSKQYPFMLANIDRWVIGENAGVECKTSRDITMRRYANGEYPEEYYCQCLHYMAVTGAHKWYLAVLVYGTDFKIFEIERKEAEIQELIKLEKDFWQQHVQTRKAPIADGSNATTNALKFVYPQAEQDLIITTDNAEPFDRYLEIQQQISRLEKEKEEIKNKAKQEMGAAEKMTTSRHIITWKNQTRKQFDVKNFSKDYPDINISDYYTHTCQRVFNIKNMKEAY